MVHSIEEAGNSPASSYIYRMEELLRQMIDELRDEVRLLKKEHEELKRQHMELWVFATRAGTLGYKLGFQYVEEAVASVFGINQIDLYVKRTPGRPKQDEVVERLARNVLANILYRFMGYPTHEISQHYGMSKKNPFYRFVNLDMLEGQWGSLSVEERRKYTMTLLNVRNLIEGEEKNGGVVIDFYKQVKFRITELLCDSDLVNYIEVTDRNRDHV